MSTIFTAIKSALAVVDIVFTRAILLLWISTLQAQRRRRRVLSH